MGVATVALTYDLTRRRFGRIGRLRRRARARAHADHGRDLAPQQPRRAARAVLRRRAVVPSCARCEDGRTRWLVLAGVCVGLGFETKMGAALLVVPGDRRGVAVGRARAAALARACASCWPAAPRWSSWAAPGRCSMALTPGVEPPVDLGHERQQHLSLILDYNGLGRLDGQAGGPRIAGGGGGRRRDDLRRRHRPAAPAQRGARRAGRVAARLRARRRDRRARGRRRACGARTPAPAGWSPTGGMFLTIAVAFSFAQGIFHPYYVSQLAPFTAALVGAGVGLVLLARPCRGHRSRPLALAAGVATELLVLARLPGQLTLAAHRAARRRRGDGRRARRRSARAVRGAVPSRPRSGCCCSPPRAGPCRRSGTRPPARSRRAVRRQVGVRRRARPRRRRRRGAGAAASALPPAPGRGSPRRRRAPAAASAAPGAPAGAGGGMGAAASAATPPG